MIYHSGEKLKLNKSGFTLLEMMTSISLIVIITAIFAANYRSNNKRTDLIMTSQTLVSNFHAAQNNTLGLIKYGDAVPAGGWGLYFDTTNPSQYILFADLNRPASDEPGDVHAADPGFGNYDSSTEGDINKGARIVSLPAGVEISSIKTDSGTTLNSASITFLPPDPRTYISASSTALDAIQVSLKDDRENTIKTVRVNFLGLIEVIDPNFVKFSF
jgi:prepilin-type N-terminal cleavage/methylation domain-containing protein